MPRQVIVAPPPICIECIVASDLARRLLHVKMSDYDISKLTYMLYYNPVQLYPICRLSEIGRTHEPSWLCTSPTLQCSTTSHFTHSVLHAGMSGFGYNTLRYVPRNVLGKCARYAVVWMTPPVAHPIAIQLLGLKCKTSAEIQRRPEDIGTWLLTIWLM